MNISVARHAGLGRGDCFLRCWLVTERIFTQQIRCWLAVPTTCANALSDTAFQSDSLKKRGYENQMTTPKFTEPITKRCMAVVAGQRCDGKPGIGECLCFTHCAQRDTDRREYDVAIVNESEFSQEWKCVGAKAAWTTGIEEESNVQPSSH